jgi:hypothetical protein
MYTNNFKLTQQREHIIVLELIFDLCEGGFLSNNYYETGSLKNTETTSCIIARPDFIICCFRKIKNRD